MQTRRSPFYKKSYPLIVVIFACFLVAPLLASAAEKKTVKKAVAKQTKVKAAVPRGKGKVVPKTAVKAVPKVDEATARATFETFAQEWMAKLAEAEEFQRTQRLKVTQDPDGFSAEYVGYLPQRFIEVKKTEYTDTPYVGTLTYYERTLRCTGKTKEQALQGPFEQVGTSQVREIFRFTRGKWVY